MRKLFTKCNCECQYVCLGYSVILESIWKYIEIYRITYSQFSVFHTLQKYPKNCIHVTGENMTIQQKKKKTTSLHFPMCFICWRGSCIVFRVYDINVMWVCECSKMKTFSARYCNGMFKINHFLYTWKHTYMVCKVYI